MPAVVAGTYELGRTSTVLARCSGVMRCDATSCGMIPSAAAFASITNCASFATQGCSYLCTHKALHTHKEQNMVQYNPTTNPNNGTSASTNNTSNLTYKQRTTTRANVPGVVLCSGPSSRTEIFTSHPDATYPGTGTFYHKHKRYFNHRH